MKYNQPGLIQKNKFSLCLSLAPKSLPVLKKEMVQVKMPGRSLAEWRRDALPPQLQDEENPMMAQFREMGRPMIYTFRRASEGGIYDYPDEVRLRSICRVMDEPMIHYIDCEVDNDPDFLLEINGEISKHSCGLILSTHHYQGIYTSSALNALVEGMRVYQPSVIKIAHTPGSFDEAEEARKVMIDLGQRLPIPVIHVLMGPYGRASRIFPEAWGGSLTYACGTEPTAPGQFTVEEILAYRKKNEKDVANPPEM